VFVADLDDRARFGHADSPATPRLSQLDGSPLPRTVQCLLAMRQRGATEEAPE
jgi:hypothetical protein